MPQPNPAITGLQASSPEDLIKQRQAINGVMSGGMSTPQQPAVNGLKSPWPHGILGTSDISVPYLWHDKEIEAQHAQDRKIHSAQPGDIELPSDETQWSIDELLRRAAALK